MTPLVRFEDIEQYRPRNRWREAQMLIKDHDHYIVFTGGQEVRILDSQFDKICVVQMNEPNSGKELLAVVAAFYAGMEYGIDRQLEYQ